MSLSTTDRNASLPRQASKLSLSTCSGNWNQSKPFYLLETWFPCRTLRPVFLNP
jgi:hypothetical protein